MIKILSQKDKKRIVDFCMKNERENLFVLGSFLLYKNGFEVNRYIGHFDGGELNGLAVYFTKYKSFVVNAESVKIINKLVDFAVKEKFEIEAIPIFEKYAIPTIKRLGHRPKKISRETIMILEKKDFVNFASGKEKVAKKRDVADLVLADRILNGLDSGQKISKEEKERINPGVNFFLKQDGRIIAKANLHGMSKNYFQIGGVITLPEYRCKGYAKQVVSALCAYYFKKGFRYGLLFTRNNNIAARKVYDSLGFKAVDKFMIVEY